MSCSKFVGILVAIVGLYASSVAHADLKLLTFNMWGAGRNAGKPVTETVAVLKAVDADIIGLQETRAEDDFCSKDDCPRPGESVAPALAEALGYHLYEQRQGTGPLWANAVLSRYPITGATENDTGVYVDVDGKSVVMFNLHLTDFPYQPYQLLGIGYEDAKPLKTADEAIAAAKAARGAELAVMLEDLKNARDTDVQIVNGDFNEPSFRDWSKRAVAAGQQPLVVEYPTTKKLESLGFKDAMRVIYPDEIARPAFTWTPTTAPDDSKDHHDRIDFIFVRGKAEVTGAGIVGEKHPEADIVVTPWPSDHRAVYATIRLTE